LNQLARPILVDRIVYTTITITIMRSHHLLRVQTLKWIDVVGVIAGPIIAMFLSHVFSGDGTTG
jgi:hypothetical protein